ncbi:hypothetical protein A6R68_17281 [Neotoma lepida]|uniref:Uncharacterized protein n=1 Tax=Neotoma lepida TaxID=56216 RepID=A0A1A6HDC5_NEOLE|nr:hypothetical protein A6R68_17281 [Neotoma lepida]
MFHLTSSTNPNDSKRRFSNRMTAASLNQGRWRLIRGPRDPQEALNCVSLLGVFSCRVFLKMNTEAEQQLLHHARNGNTEEVRKLLEAMERTEVIADINCKGPAPGAGPGHFRVLRSVQAQVTSGLRPSPPDVNCSDQLGNTPLHCAAYRAHKQCALQLLRSGADPNLKNKNDQKPLDLAHGAEMKHILVGNKKWLEAIEEHSAYSTHYCSQDQVTDEEEEDAVSPMDLKESLERAQTCQQKLDREIYNFLKMIKECDVAKVFSEVENRSQDCKKSIPFAFLSFLSSSVLAV